MCLNLVFDCILNLKCKENPDIGCYPDYTNGSRDLNGTHFYDRSGELVCTLKL